MTVHSEAFKALLTLERYCEERKCEDCCFYLGDDHDNTGYCDLDCWDVADTPTISKRVHFLEELDIEKQESDSNDKRTSNAL